MKQQYPSNAYLLLDSNGEELRWNTHERDEAQQQEQKQRQESNAFQNPNWKRDVETTTSLIETEWEPVKEPYDNANHWGTSTPWYWDTTTNSYWEKTKETYWDVSMSTYWQTTSDYPFWQQNLGTVTAATTTSPTNHIHTTDLTTTTTPSVHAVPDVTEDLIWGRLFVVTPAPSSKLHQPLALPMKTCPHRFDAVTRGKL